VKKMIYRILFLFYHYYNNGSAKEIAYFSSLTAFISLLFLNLYAILIYFGVDDLVFPFLNETSRPYRYVNIFFFLIPVYILMYKIFRKEELSKIQIDNKSLRKQQNILAIYYVSSVCLLLFVIFRYA
jgi:hypothetical protein